MVKNESFFDANLKLKFKKNDRKNRQKANKSD